MCRLFILFVLLAVIRKEDAQAWGVHACFIYCSELEPGTSRGAWHIVGFQKTRAYLSFNLFLLSFTHPPVYPSIPSLPPFLLARLRVAGPVRLNEFFMIHLSLEPSEPPECCSPLSSQCLAQTQSHWSHRDRRTRPRAHPQGHGLVVRVFCDRVIREGSQGATGPDFTQGQRSRLATALPLSLPTSATYLASVPEPPHQSACGSGRWSGSRGWCLAPAWWPSGSGPCAVGPVPALISSSSGCTFLAVGRPWAGVMGRGWRKAPVSSCVFMKDIEQRAQASLPAQATITSHLDYSSSFLPGFSASILVPCTIHPPLNSQRDLVKPKSDQIPPLLERNPPRIPTLKEKPKSFLHDLAFCSHSDFFSQSSPTLCSRSTGLCDIPPTPQAYTYLRAFAHALPAAWKLPPPHPHLHGSLPHVISGLFLPLITP